MTDLIAEVGLAHEGSIWLAHSYVDAVADAGATAVKFQFHTPLESSPLETWRNPPPTGETRAAYWTRTSFTRTQWVELADHARHKGLCFGGSFFHDSLIDELAPLCDFVKVPSGAATYPLLIEKVAATGKPVYISDGLHLDIPESWTRLICTSKYPTPLAEVGVNEIRPGVDGLSDHSGDPLVCALATYAGAVAVEVHVTFDKRTGLPDAQSSLTVDELAQARKMMLGAHYVRHAVRPAPDPTAQERFGYALRGGNWCKPAA